MLLAVLLTHSATRVTSMAPGLNGVRMAAEDTGEEPVSNEVMESQLKAATAAKLSEEEDENNLPHGTPSWHPARAHHAVDAADDEAEAVESPHDDFANSASPSTEAAADSKAEAAQKAEVRANSSLESVRAHRAICVSAELRRA